MIFDDNKPQVLIIAKKLIYNILDLPIENIVLEAEGEGEGYNACQFTLKNHLIKFRSGKITPKKKGQFITFWKRSKSGPIIPYEAIDPFDFLVISLNTKTRFGQFIFPKSALLKYGIVSKNGKVENELCEFILPGINLIINNLKQISSGSYNIFLR
ncbi:MAG: MepB family protein [Candidatus Babeliales bacterium]